MGDFRAHGKVQPQAQERPAQGAPGKDPQMALQTCPKRRTCCPRPSEEAMHTSVEGAAKAGPKDERQQRLQRLGTSCSRTRRSMAWPLRCTRPSSRGSSEATGPEAGRRCNSRGIRSHGLRRRLHGSRKRRGHGGRMPKSKALNTSGSPSEVEIRDHPDAWAFSTNCAAPAGPSLSLRTATSRREAKKKARTPGSQVCKRWSPLLAQASQRATQLP